MRKSYPYITIGLLLALFIAVYSCKKVTGIDNSQVVETPFSLFFADTSGAVYNSDSINGGIIARRIFESDGYPVKAIAVSYNNILLCKSNLYFSSNNGVNFNHSYDSLASYPGHACAGYPFDLNQSMIISIPSWNPSVFIANDDNYVLNYTGVSSSQYSGGQGGWVLERSDTTGAYGNYSGDPHYLIRMTSFTLLADGVLCGYDAHSNRNFYRFQSPGLWIECSPGSTDPTDWPGIGNPSAQTGNPLPHHNIFVPPPYSTVDTTARYSYGHINNQLIAIDQINCHPDSSAYYSTDTGRNWTAFKGLPGNPLLCIESPFEEICLIGTAGAGLYMLNTNTNQWQPNNNGLPQNLTVRSIVGKEMFYKNGKTQKYFFLATNAGIYQSTDDGIDWTLALAGNFTAIY